MKNNRSKKRILLAQILCIAGCLLFCSFLCGKYLILATFNESYHGTKNTITYQTIEDSVIEGDFYDRDGALILGNASPGQSAYAEKPKNYSYAWLVGYYSVNGGVENTFGLRGNLKDYSLFHLDAENKGASITLTTDNRLQNKAFALLNGNEGSITVIDNKTGAILALSSQSTVTYDVNDMESLLNSDVPGSQFRRGTYENDPPGSTFKVITAAAALKKAEDDNLDSSFFQFVDAGSYTPAGSDYVITNYNNVTYGNIDLEEAMNHSVNCYFADLGIRTGASYLQKTASAFMLGKDIDIPYLCTLHSSMNFADEKPITIAQTSFGQGDTQITPAHLCLIAQAIANDGKMMRPYIVQNIKSGNHTLYRHINRKLSTALKNSVDVKLKEIMHSTALLYGLDEATYGMVYAKTGTAECAEGRIHTYMIGFTKDASFCISMNNSLHSTDLYPVARQLVSAINEIYE
ncbi:MAG: hypothetical protein IKR11_04865 [Solobacterium sp.]|nr:hypothetical protein [Solobacterium sp.]